VTQNCNTCEGKFMGEEIAQNSAQCGNKMPKIGLFPPKMVE